MIFAASPETHTVADARQVLAVVDSFAQADADDSLAGLFGGKIGLTRAERIAVEQEEGWILGMPPLLPACFESPPGLRSAGRR